MVGNRKLQVRRNRGGRHNLHRRYKNVAGGDFELEAPEGHILAVADVEEILSDPPRVLVVGMAVFFGGGGNRRHRAVARFAAQPAKKGAHQKFCVEAVSFFAPAALRAKQPRSTGGSRALQRLGRAANVRAKSRRVQLHKPGRRVGSDVPHPPPPVASDAAVSAIHPDPVRSFFKGRRATPGNSPATSQLDWLNSTTTTNVAA